MAKKSGSKRASYSADADGLQKKIDAARSALPGLKELTAPPRGKKQTAGGVVSDKFIEAIAAQAERDPAFRAATGVDPDRLRNGNRFVIAYSPIVDSLLTFGQETKELVLETKKANSQEARAAYAWMQWKADHQKDAKYARLVKKLAAIMKAKPSKANGKGKSKKRANGAAANGSPSTTASKTTQRVTETVTEELP